jgi:protein-S-isoprenylcysteine O-methyltransferase Ste14
MQLLKEIKALKTCPYAGHDVKLGKDAQGNQICTTCNNKVAKELDVKLAVILFFASLVLFFVVFVTLAALTKSAAPSWAMILGLSAVSAYFGANRFVKANLNQEQ